MGLTTTTDRVTYSGDASTTSFSFGYRFYADADLVVITKVNSTGVETVKTLTTHYTISGTATGGVYLSGANVVFGTAPASGTTIIIYRDRSVTQELEPTENGKIPSDSVEKQLDKLVTYVQRVKNKLARTVGFKEGYTGSMSPDLPALVVADGYLKTNAAGDGLEYISEADLITTVQGGPQSFTASRAIVSDASGYATSATTTATEIGYVNGVTSQLSGNSQSATLTNKTIDADANTITNIENADIKAGAAIDASKLADGSVSNAEFQYLSTVTSNIQTQLDAKVDESAGLISNYLNFTDQGSDPSSPSAGLRSLYSLVNGFAYKTSAGNVRTFAVLEGAQTFTAAKQFDSVTFTTNPVGLTVGQIAFPATQNPSAGANTLDDYSEGTFTPTVSGTSTAGAATYTTQSGSYTKIGNVVFFQMKLGWSAHTGTGNTFFGGLPYTTNSSADKQTALSIFTDGHALSGSSQMQAKVDANATTITLEQYSTTSGPSVPVAIDTLVGTFIITGQYFV